MCLVDLATAESVDRQLMWKAFARLGVLDKMTSIICWFHDGMRACILMNTGRCLERFTISRASPRLCACLSAVQRFFAPVLAVVQRRFEADATANTDLVRILDGRRVWGAMKEEEKEEKRKGFH